MTANVRWPIFPDEFTGGYGSHSEMLSINYYLKEVLEFLLSVAFTKCGGRFRPTWTTSGARYQYFPGLPRQNVDIVEVFEKLFDLSSEIMHQINQLKLGLRENCTGYEMRLWPTDVTGYNLHAASKRWELRDLVRDTSIRLASLISTKLDGRPVPNDYNAFSRCVTMLRRYIARYENLDTHYAKRDSLARVTEIESPEAEDAVETTRSVDLSHETCESSSESSMTDNTLLSQQSCSFSQDERLCNPPIENDQTDQQGL